MKRIAGLLPLLALTMLLSGCIETVVLIHVDKDGSGTVAETVKMNNMVAGMLKGMVGSMQEAFTEEGGDTAGEPAAGGEQAAAGEAMNEEMFSEEKAREKAENMGPGVELLTYDEVEDNAFSGYKAVYRFDDINELRVNQNPSASMPSMPGEVESDESDEEYVLFSFSQGSPARLEITMPEGDEEESVEEEMEMDVDGADGGEENGMADGFGQMKEMFRGMRLSIAMEFGGDITETNATYVDGNTVTLIDFNFDVLLDNPEALKKLEASENMSPAESKKILHEIPGIKFDVAETIVVAFD